MKIMNLDLRIALLGGTVNYSENVVTRRAVASPVNQDSVDSDNVHSERKILENITKDLNCLQGGGKGQLRAECDTCDRKVAPTRAA